MAYTIHQCMYQLVTTAKGFGANHLAIIGGLGFLQIVAQALSCNVLFTQTCIKLPRSTKSLLASFFCVCSSTTFVNLSHIGSVEVAPSLQSSVSPQQHNTETHLSRDMEKAPNLIMETGKSLHPHFPCSYSQ